MNLPITLTLALALSAAPAVSAQSADAFSAISDSIVSNNILAKYNLSKHRSDSLALLADNNLSDPEIEFSHLWRQKGVGNKWSVGVSQSFEWPSVYSSRRKEIASAAEALAFELDASRIDIRQQVTSALIDYVYASKLIDLNASIVSNIDSLSALYSRGFDLGEVTRLDINKLRIERISAAKGLSEARSRLDEAVARLSALNGGSLPRRLMTLNSYPDCMLRPEEQYVSEALSLNPDLNYLDAMRQNVAQRAATLSRQRYPGFSIGYNHENEMGDHFNGFSVGLTLPVFSTRHKAAAASAAVVDMDLKMLDEKAAVTAGIKADYAKARSLLSDIMLYRSALDDADNMRLLAKALAGGQISLTEYLLQVRYFLEAKLDYLELDYQYQLCVNRLERFAR